MAIMEMLMQMATIKMAIVETVCVNQLSNHAFPFAGDYNNNNGRDGSGNGHHHGKGK